MTRAWRYRCALLAVGFGSFGAHSELALPDMPPPLPPCSNDKIAVEEECPGGFEGPAGEQISWVSFHAQLYNARAAIFASGGLAEAVTATHRLLQSVTLHFSQAFSCLPAVVAAYYSLSRMLALQGRVRRALAMLQLGFIFVRDRGFSECTPWPVQGWDMMLAGRSLSERVRVLDAPSLSEVHRSYRSGQSSADSQTAPFKVGIVTICAYAAEEPVRVFCAENRRLYTSLHGYDVHFFTDASEIAVHRDAKMDVKDGLHKPFFWKVNAVKNILDTGKYDWLLWMDCDAFFMDPVRTIDSVIQLYSGSNHFATTKTSEHHVPVRARLDAETSTPISLIIVVDSTGLNNGVWLIKNTPWSHTFLTDWWHSDILEGPGSNHNCSDQSTMLHTLLQDRAMDLDSAWDAVEGPIWPPQVRVARQEHLQSFHEATAATAMSRAWTEGDFIKHHPGCHYYKEPCQFLYYEAETNFRNKVLELQAKHALT